MPRATRRYPLRSLAAVSDHAGRRHPVSLAKRNGRAIVVHSCFDDAGETPDDELDVEPGDPRMERLRRFVLLAASGRFSRIELRTIYALAVDGLSVAQIACIDRCSRQAVMARLYGNSKGQGGLLKKTVRFWRDAANQSANIKSYFRSSLRVDDDRINNGATSAHTRID